MALNSLVFTLLILNILIVSGKQASQAIYVLVFIYFAVLIFVSLNKMGGGD